jgi:hypothetical protein
MAPSKSHERRGCYPSLPPPSALDRAAQGDFQVKAPKAEKGKHQEKMPKAMKGGFQEKRGGFSVPIAAVVVPPWLDVKEVELLRVASLAARREEEKAALKAANAPKKAKRRCMSGG